MPVTIKKVTSLDLTPAVGSETPAPEHTAVVTPAVVLTGTDAHCVSGTEDPPLSV